MKWKEQPISEVFVLKQGTYLQTEEMVESRTDEFPFAVYGANGVVGYSTKMMYAERTPLISCRGANCGVVHFTEPNAWVGNNSIACIPKGEVDPRFFFYQFSNSLFTDVITGAAQPQITLTNLSPKAIVVPPIAVQRSVGDILSAYDEAMENNRRRMGLLEKAARLLYEEWFVRLRFPGHEHTPITHGFPQGWERKPIQELLEFTIGGGWGGDEHDAKFTEPAFVIRGTDIPDIKVGDFTRIPNRFHVPSNLSSRKLQSGDIILEISNGNLRNIGRTLRVEAQHLLALPGDVMCASFCRMLRPKGEMESQLLASHLEEMQEGGRMDFFKTPSAAGINNFRFTGLLEDEFVLIPPRALLLEFVSQVAAIRAQLANLALQNQKLRAARDLLLPRLMSGEIEV